MAKKTCMYTDDDNKSSIYKARGIKHDDDYKSICCSSTSTTKKAIIIIVHVRIQEEISNININAQEITYIRKNNKILFYLFVLSLVL